MLTMRKMIKNLLCLCITAVVLASCGTSNNVVNHGIFQKRKHTSGIFIKTRGTAKTEDVAVAEKPVAKKQAVIAAEPVRTAAVEAVETEETSVAENTVAAVETPARVSDAVVASEEAATPAAHKSAAQAPVVNTERQSEGEIRKSLKMDVKKHKKQSGQGNSDDMFILAVIFAILIPPIGVLIYTNIDWLKVLICLLLTLLFFLPGMIYALLVVFDVF
jgi:uncharacterized membrane protein YqaE (UPF0057 family)